MQRLESMLDVTYLLNQWKDQRRLLANEYDYSIRNLRSTSIPVPSDIGYYSNKDVIRLQELAERGLDWRKAVKLARTNAKIKQVCSFYVLHRKLDQLNANLLSEMYILT